MAKNPHARAANWPLWIGLTLVLLVAFAAVAGPTLAPRDPLEENKIIQGGDEWYTPPFPAFTIPEFPLGSDRFGRDMLSQLLWAIRPTLILVLTVAAVRLLIGTLIGLGAGWSEGRSGQLLDSLIAGALAVPVLMIALVAIAAIGVELGIWAFIFGLSINGWAETAQMIREQTRLIKKQAYIEAAYAAGASDLQIILIHVLRQLAPMIWMLMAFEVSSTLTITAGLGFLGYYIGGDVWIVVADWVARRTSGVPELGQMLATSHVRIDQPWGMVITGSVVFWMVLGFNLLGEGLRRRLALERLSHRSLYSRVVDEGLPWLQEQLWQPSRRWVRRYPLPTGVGAVILLFLLGGGALWWRTQTLAHPGPADLATPISVPGGHLWADQRYDPYGTQNPPTTGPANPQAKMIFQAPDGLSGGPAIAADGTLYIAGTTTLYALDPQGAVRWQVTLPLTPAIGSPALAPDGTIYVVEKPGGLTAFTPEGKVRWHFLPEQPKIAASGPIVGPDGTIYYGFGSNLQALTAEGQPLWRTPVPAASRPVPPRLSPDGKRLTWKNLIVDARDGRPIEYEVISNSDDCITGADGRDYLRSGHIIMQWTEEAGQLRILRNATWDYDEFTFLSPKNSGVTMDQTAWIYYADYNDSSMVWLDMEGRIAGQAASSGMFHAELLAVDQEETGYICGGLETRNIAACAALSPHSTDPLWEVKFEGQVIRGGALAPGRLYVALNEGALYALAD